PVSSFLVLFFFLVIRLLPRSTLFPYTTLFRSVVSMAMRSANRVDGSVFMVCFDLLSYLLCTAGTGSRRDRVPRRLLERCMGFARDRKSTRLNSSHLGISYAVFCLKKKKKKDK